MGEGGGMSGISESWGAAVGPVPDTESDTDGLPGGPAADMGGGGGGGPPSRGRGAAAAGGGGAAAGRSSALLAPARKLAAELVGLSSSALFFSRRPLTLSRIEPRRDRDEPWVSVLMMGRVRAPPSSAPPNELVEPRAEGLLPSPPDRFDGCWPMLGKTGGDYVVVVALKSIVEGDGWG